MLNLFAEVLLPFDHVASCPPFIYRLPFPACSYWGPENITCFRFPPPPLFRIKIIKIKY